MRNIKIAHLVYLIAGLLVIFSFFILSGCNNREPLKIGFMGGLSGRNSELAVSRRNGVQLAVNKLNKEGGIQGRQIQLLIKDNLNDAQVALKVTDELVAAGVPAIVGAFTSELLSEK